MYVREWLSVSVFCMESLRGLVWLEKENAASFYDHGFSLIRNASRYCLKNPKLAASAYSTFDWFCSPSSANHKSSLILPCRAEAFFPFVKYAFVESFLPTRLGNRHFRFFSFPHKTDDLFVGIDFLHKFLPNLIFQYRKKLAKLLAQFYGFRSNLISPILLMLEIFTS